MENPTADLRPHKRAKLEDLHTMEDKSDAAGVAPTDQTLQTTLGQGNVANTSTSDDHSKELEVGITNFVDESRRVFKGILKKRYTDFLVNEILLDGSVLHLQKTHSKDEIQPAPSRDGLASTTQDLVDQARMDTAEADVNDGGVKDEILEPMGQEPNGAPETKPTRPNPEVSENDRMKLVEYFNEEVVVQLISLYNSILNHPGKKSRDHATVRTPFTSDRSIRSQIHQDIRRIFECKIDSSTDKDGILVLTAAASSNRNGRSAKSSDKGNNRPGKLSWLDRGGEHVHFTLYKENKDTLEVISFLTKQLKTTNKTFQFAGTKDRRAVTVQRVSAYRMEAERLAGLNRVLKYSAIGDFQYRRQGLELGDLSGNEFVVTLRDCNLLGTPDITGLERLSAANAYLSQSLQQLRKKGFLNYYGLQRFGTFATRTDVVGQKILQGDFQGACDAILHFSSLALKAADAELTSVLVGQDDRDRAAGINIFRTTGKISDALDRVPRKFSAEVAVIRHLGRRPQDFLGALLSIQRNLRLMYVHAYQSLVWNLAVGERWRLFGDHVVEGDLVLVHEHKAKEGGEEVTQGQTVDADGEIVIAPSADDRAYDPDDMFERARPLSAAEAAGGEYNIFDVVLPLPGFDVLYPSNAVGDWYQNFMASETGGGLDPHNMRRKQKDFSLSGGYRKVLARVGKDFDVRVYEYEDDDRQFVETDMDRIEKGGAGTEDGIQDTKECTADRKAEDARTPQKKLAAVLQFQLGSSQYATIALRELSQGGIQAYKPEFMGGR